MLTERKKNNFQSLDKNLPLKFRKLLPRPDSALRKSFEDFTQETSGDYVYTYVDYNRPTDAIQCSSGTCPNTLGTLNAAPQGGAVALAQLTLSLSGDYSELFNGIIRFFVETNNVADANAVVHVEIADTVSDLGTNSDDYEITLSGNAPDFLPYLVDLSQAPTTVNGTGWGQATTGVAVRIELDAVPTGTVGFSTFEWYEDLVDINSPKLIKAYCLDGLSLNRTYEVVESPCKELISVTDKAVEFTVTVNSETDDLYEVMVDAQRTDDTTVIERREISKTVTSFTDPVTSVGRGQISLPEISSDVCIPVDVLVTSRCDDNGGSTILREVTNYSPDQEIPVGYFYVARGEYDSSVNNTILVNSDYVDDEVVVDYYVDVTGTKIVETDDFQNVVMSMFWDLEIGDRKRTYEIPRAVVTAFNRSAALNDNHTWELTIQVPATNGQYLLQHISY